MRNRDQVWSAFGPSGGCSLLDSCFSALSSGSFGDSLIPMSYPITLVVAPGQTGRSWIVPTGAGHPMCPAPVGSRC